MATLSRVSAKVTGAAKAMEKALRGYPAIFRHLAGEHGEVATLLARVAASSEDIEIRGELFPEIRKSLLAHAKAEEKEFYEPLRGFSRTASMIPQALEEHRQIEQLLEQLHGQSFTSATWFGTFQTLCTAVEAHVEREENELFVAAKEVLDSDRAKQMEESYERTEEREKARL